LSDRLDRGPEDTLQQLANEMTDPRPGAEALIARLRDVILIQAVRGWLESQLQHPGRRAAARLSHELAPDRGSAMAAEPFSTVGRASRLPDHAHPPGLDWVARI